MKGIGFALLAAGGIGIFLGSKMYGDIGIAALIGAVPAILSGAGFLKASQAIKRLNQTE